MSNSETRYVIDTTHVDGKTMDKIHELMSEGHSVKETADILGLRTQTIKLLKPVKNKESDEVMEED